MADTLKIFRGVLLTAVGLVVVYESILYRLIDLVLVIGIILTIFGIGSLIAVFISRVMNLNENEDNNGRYVKSEKPLKINHQDYGEDSQKYLSYSSSPNTQRSEKISKNNIKSSESRLVNENKESFINKSAKSLSNFLSLSDDSKVANPKAVLRENPEAYEDYVEEPLENDLNAEFYEDDFFKKEYEEQAQISQVRQFKFTPNYEKPMKVTRKPKKRPVDDISLADFKRAPKRTNEISNALSNGDKSIRVMPDHESLSEVIIPIHNQFKDKEDKFSKVNDYNDSVELLNDVDNKIDIYDDSNSNSLANVNNINRTNGAVFDNDLAEDPIVIVHDDENSNLNSSISSNLTGDYGLDIGDENFNLVEDYGLDIEDKANLTSESVQSNLSSLVDYKTEPNNLADLNSESSKTIHIDPNDPNSVPIPKLLKSYVICSKGILTSQEAFEEVAKHAKNDIFLEAPSIKDMGEIFLSHISKLNSKVIIQEFDIEDMSYVLLLSSLIKQGIKIKTLPLVNSFNLIGDNHALIISNSVDDEELEYGAVYTDDKSISEIKELFEDSWKLANDLDDVLSK